MRSPYVPPKITLRASARSREKLSMDPVEVFCRIRPISAATPVIRTASREPKNATEPCIHAVDERTVHLIAPSAAFEDGNVVKVQKCMFTYVFDEAASQKNVFDRVSYDLVSDLILGKNGLLFTYGVTGSGKTYTMTGSPKEIGILPRCLDTLFNSIGNFQAPKLVFKVDTRINAFNVQSEIDAELEGRKEARRMKNVPTEPKSARKMPMAPVFAWDKIDWELFPRNVETDRVQVIEEDNAYAVFISYVQVYNNYVYDLLDPLMPSDPDKLPPSKLLREDMDHNMFVCDVTEVEVKNTEEAFNVFMQGQSVRRTAHTQLNTESSRSHSVFNIRLLQAPLDANGREVIQDRRRIHVSQLSLVDLAGSERSSRTGNVGDRMRETGNINESLMTLRQCLEQLRENQKTGANKLVPYRNSRLTHLFKNYFDGEGKVRMIVCVSPLAAEYDETKHVMEFSELTQEVEVARAKCIGFQESSEGVTLTPGRRRAAAIADQVHDRLERDLAGLAHRNDENGIEANVLLPRPPTVPSLFFDPVPSVNIQAVTADNGAWILQLRNHMESRCKRRTNLLANVGEKSSEFESELRKFVIDHEALKEQFRDQCQQNGERERENVRLRAELRGVQSRILTLESAKAKHERDTKYLQNQEDQLKKRERDMAAEVRQKDEKLRAVKEIFERAAMLTPRVGGTIGRQICQENGGFKSAAPCAVAYSRNVAYSRGVPVTQIRPVRAAAATASITTTKRRRSMSPPPDMCTCHGGGDAEESPMVYRCSNTSRSRRNRDCRRRSKSVDSSSTAYSVADMKTAKPVYDDISDSE